MSSSKRCIYPVAKILSLFPYPVADFGVYYNNGSPNCQQRKIWDRFIFSFAAITNWQLFKLLSHKKKKRFVQRKKRCFEQCVYRSMNNRAQEKKKTQSERPQHDQRKSVLYMTLNFLLSRIFFLAQIILRIPYNFWLEIANLSRDIALAGLLAYGKQNR